MLGDRFGNASQFKTCKSRQRRRFLFDRDTFWKALKCVSILCVVLIETLPFEVAATERAGDSPLSVGVFA